MPPISRRNKKLIFIHGLAATLFMFSLAEIPSLHWTTPLLASEAGKPAAQATHKSPTKPGEVPPLNANKFIDTLHGLKGKVVVVNMWATWCAPCRQEFPLLVKLYEQYKPKGVEVLAISNDDIQNLDDVKHFLKERQASFPTFIVDGTDTDALREAIYPQWTGGIPSTFFFDRQGVLKGRIFGPIDPKEFEATIKPLL
jgi:thiol-disulfide isomerase/thioredoxin